MIKVKSVLESKFEKIPLQLYDNAAQGSIAVAEEMAELIKEKSVKGEMAVLGLATGSSPKRVYSELVRLHREEGLSFKNVITFNLDEYYPMEPDAINSYVRFMKEHLFDHVDIDPANYHIPDGTIPIEKVPEYCAWYEESIELAGGFDFQLLGIGGNGHIGFNEPGSKVNSVTRLIALDHSTRAAAAGDFNGLNNTPRRAITMGIQKIMEAKRVVLLAWGEGKANVVKESVEGPVTDKVPASLLQNHPNVIFVVDEGASNKLIRKQQPWLVTQVLWDDRMRRKAVVNLALSLGKPVLKLTDEDYNKAGLNDLVTQQGPAYDINLKIFNELQHTITGWPGGKPDADDSQRPERAKPARKRVLIFSPHPDDDIISMGGTFIRLVEQGHEVHVAYQTSGNIAVPDDEAVRYSDYVHEFASSIGMQNGKTKEIYERVLNFIKNKKASERDTDEVLNIKGLVRRSEARATCRYVGISDDQCHFLNLPFYETGRPEKNPLGEQDVKIMMDIIEQVKPHQIYAAGDLADPHKTHKVCLDAVMEAVSRLKSKAFMKDCWLWLYRGAWQEWEIDQIEMAVPMSPEEVKRKRHGIFKHQSQKDNVVFQGSDSREFWQRAEDRNGETAQLYDALGLAEYEAMEAFVRWHY